MVKDLTEGRPGRVLALFSIPSLISVVFQQLYNMADNVVAGQFIGDDALSAVSVSYPVTMIYMAVALGINIGTMGFMAELESNEMHLLRKLRDDRYTTEARMMLQVEVIRGGEVVWQELALNDAVIAKGAVARIIQLTVVCDGVDVMQVIGDGLILGTPTGSTAYSMSAGGPIVEPTAHNILITPICAHDMMTRPFVTSSKRTISARIGKVGRRNAYLSIDGGKAFKLSTGDTIQVTRAARDAQLVKLKEQSFFEVVNQKFGTDKRRFL